MRSCVGIPAGPSSLPAPSAPSPTAGAIPHRHWEPHPPAWALICACVPPWLVRPRGGLERRPEARGCAYELRKGFQRYDARFSCDLISLTCPAAAQSQPECTWLLGLLTTSSRETVVLQRCSSSLSRTVRLLARRVRNFGTPRLLRTARRRPRLPRPSPRISTLSSLIPRQQHNSAVSRFLPWRPRSLHVLLRRFGRPRASAKPSGLGSTLAYTLSASLDCRSQIRHSAAASRQRVRHGTILGFLRAKSRGDTTSPTRWGAGSVSHTP